MKFLLIFFSIAGLTQTLASTLSGRIFRGYEVVKGNLTLFPFQVLLNINGSDYMDICSGVLIEKCWILTAAHCVEDYETTDISAYLGSVHFNDTNIVRRVERNNVIIHTNYNNLTLANDVALLKVHEVIYTNRIQPVRLPSIRKVKKSTFLNKIALVSGWGAKGNGKPHSDILRYTLVQVVSHKICKKVYNGPDEFHKSEICVTTDMVGSPCIGDSGGPLLDVASEVLIGIFSSAYADDCESSKPVIYTSIIDHRLWIRTITGI